MLAKTVAAFFIATLGLGCGSKGAVSLSARIEGPSLSVTSGALVTTLSGELDLVLELGSVASSSTTVQLQSLAVVRGESVLVDSISVSSSEDFPITLEPGDELTARLTIDQEALATELADTICEGPVQFALVLTDSSSDGKPSSPRSLSFEPTCP